MISKDHDIQFMLRTRYGQCPRMTWSMEASISSRSPGLRGSFRPNEPEGAPTSGFKSASHNVPAAGRAPVWKYFLIALDTQSEGAAIVVCYRTMSKH